MYDLLLKKARILNGGLKKSYISDIAIKEGRIHKIGEIDIKDSKEVICCTGLYVSPGFIDSHSHEDIVFGSEFSELGKISQGITTVVAGNCGISLYPVKKETVKLSKKVLNSVGVDYSDNFLLKCSDYEEYIENLKSLESRLNYKLLVGHGSLRTAVMGFDDRKPNDEEMKEMKALLRQAMKNGAVGLSTGFAYPPGSFAKNEEIVELLKVVNEFGGVYSTHMRNEADMVVDSVLESIEAARTAKVDLVISHHKIAGKHNWGLSQKTLEIIRKNIELGVNIVLDQYPYTAASSWISGVVPPRYKDGGLEKFIERLRNHEIREEIKNEILNQSYNWENYYRNCGGFSGILIADLPVTKEAKGMTVGDYAELIEKDEFETYFDLMIENNGDGVAVFNMMDNQDVERIIKFPYTMIGTDGISLNADLVSHPRGYGSFTRVISTYVKEKGLLSLEEAVNKMTKCPAEAYGIMNKGEIKEGYDADLVIFNLEEVLDKASYHKPYELSEGIDTVIVNGEVCYRDKCLTEVFKGELI